MRGAWAALCRLLPLLLLLFHRTSAKGEFSGELVLGALPRALPLKRKSSRANPK